MCTLEKRRNIFILTFTGDGEHRFSPSVISSLLSTIREVKAQATRGSVLITTSQGKFYSNGFDLAWAQAAGSKMMERLGHMVESFRPVMAEMLSMPMPTIAALQGHAAAAGFLFALSHDYIYMRSDKGVLYMSEIDLGLPLPDYFMAVFKSKLHGASTQRDVLLRGAKVRGLDAMKTGIVDGAYDSEQSLDEATMRLGEQLSSRKWDGENYKETRMSLFPGRCGELGLGPKKPEPKL